MQFTVFSKTTLVKIKPESQIKLILITYLFKPILPNYYNFICREYKEVLKKFCILKKYEVFDIWYIFHLWYISGQTSQISSAQESHVASVNHIGQPNFRTLHCGRWYSTLLSDCQSCGFTSQLSLICTPQLLYLWVML